MRVELNGTDRDVEDGSTVADLVVVVGAPPTGIAVAVDGAVVPRSQWTRTVPDGAVVEVLTAVQGG